MEAATPGTPSTRSCVPRQSVKSFCPYLRTTPWAWAPRILDLRSCSKPLITESTTVSAQTPVATPPMEMRVMSMVAGRRGRSCGSPARAACRATRSCQADHATPASNPGTTPVTTMRKSAPSIRAFSRRWLRAT